jgi:hypothetical protein
LNLTRKRDDINNLYVTPKRQANTEKITTKKEIDSVKFCKKAKTAQPTNRINTLTHHFA